MSYAARADAVLNGFSSRLQQVPIAMPQMCVAAWLKAKTPLRQVGGRASTEKAHRQTWRQTHSVYKIRDQIYNGLAVELMKR